MALESSTGKHSSNSDTRNLTYSLSTKDPPGGNATREDKDYISMEEVGRHNLAHDCWVVVDGKVFE